MRNKSSFIQMYAGFFIYSISGILSKFAAQKEFLSLPYILYFIGIAFVFFVYAILWQQILRQIPLSVAMAHKSIVIVLGLCWGFLLFEEPLSGKLLVGTVIIIAGIIMMGIGDER